MKRRAFIAGLGSAAAWPIVARAQRGEQLKRVGFLSGSAADDPEAKRRFESFVQGLQQLGWINGRNVRIDTRFGAGNSAEINKYAVELVALAPDVILTGGSTLVPLQQVTHSVPIVFVATSDPVGGGLVDSLARPGGNATGFLMFEYSLAGKWLELLKQIASGVMRVAVIRDSNRTSGTGQFGAIQAVSQSLGVEVSPINAQEPAQIERAVAVFARSANSGLIATASPLTLGHSDLIVKLAARHNLPAVYWDRTFVANGGLISYGADLTDQFQRAAGYVDRILKGEKPADMPVQAPTKYELVINLKTAKALGLEVPPTLLARADEVIE